eukprot:153202_1
MPVIDDSDTVAVSELFNDYLPKSKTDFVDFVLLTDGRQSMPETFESEFEKCTELYKSAGGKLDCSAVFVLEDGKHTKVTKQVMKVFGNSVVCTPRTMIKQLKETEQGIKQINEAEKKVAITNQVISKMIAKAHKAVAPLKLNKDGNVEQAMEAINKQCEHAAETRVEMQKIFEEIQNNPIMPTLDDIIDEMEESKDEPNETRALSDEENDKKHSENKIEQETIWDNALAIVVETFLTNEKIIGQLKNSVFNDSTFKLVSVAENNDQKHIKNESGKQKEEEKEIDSKSIEINVGSSSTNFKTVYLPHENMTVSPTPVNYQHSGWNDRFSVKVIDKNLVVTRLDSSGGWGQNLILQAVIQPKKKEISTQEHNGDLSYVLTFSCVQAPTCPDEHDLTMFHTSSSGYACDGCTVVYNQPQLLGKNTVLYGCRQCGYDLCNFCYSKEEKKK